MDKKKFYRDNENRLFLGVCSGVAEYFDMDLKIARIIIAVISLFSLPMSIVIYFLVALFTEMK